MKLATYKDGSRDGQLVVVSRDLTIAHPATHIASRLQQALDDWGFIAPQLNDLYVTLNHGKARHSFQFDAQRCAAARETSTAASTWSQPRRVSSPRASRPSAYRAKTWTSSPMMRTGCWLWLGSTSLAAAGTSVKRKR